MGTKHKTKYRDFDYAFGKSEGGSESYGGWLKIGLRSNKSITTSLGAMTSR